MYCVAVLRSISCFSIYLIERSMSTVPSSYTCIEHDINIFLGFTNACGCFVQAQGMNYLHQLKPPIVHRDLKSPNLLVDGRYTVKVSWILIMFWYILKIFSYFPPFFLHVYRFFTILGCEKLLCSLFQRKYLNTKVE